MRPPYHPLSVPGPQEKAIAKQIGGYRFRRGFLQTFEETVACLVHDASANQFEQALANLATMLGFSSERLDIHGEGPDVLWLLPIKVGLVIEAKSRKKEKGALTKDDHGQLLVAAEWFKRNYPDYACVRVSVLPQNQATRAAGAGGSYALTYERLGSLVCDARTLLTKLCESQLSGVDLEAECGRLLRQSSLTPQQIAKAYLLPFEEST